MKDESNIVDVPKLDGLTELFTKQEVHGFIVKEWSISQFSQLYPYLKVSFTPLLQKGLNLDNIEEVVTNHWNLIVDSLIPASADILKISCPGKEKEIDSLPWSEGCVVLGCILKKNMEHVGDFFAQFVKRNQEESPSKTN